MNRPLFKQLRIGEFVCDIQPCGRQCGFTPGQHHFFFVIELTVRELDENGWIIDNMACARIFEKWNTGRWVASCEDLAGGAVCELVRLLGDRAECVSCTIRPNDFASLTCEWKRGEELPRWQPRPVTRKAEPARRKARAGREALWA